MEPIERILYIMPVFLVSLSIHEYAHGWMAYRFGDNTAKSMGRLTLNPIAHLDVIGTLFLPALGLFYNMPVFGWAKPVPVDVRKLNRPYLGMALVAAAGPASNFVLAILSAFVMGIAVRAGFTSEKFLGACYLMIQFNIMLGIFNLLPLPPLDGFRIVQSILKLRFTRLLALSERFGILILIALIYFGGLRWMWGPIREISGALTAIALGRLP